MERQDPEAAWGKKENEKIVLRHEVEEDSRPVLETQEGKEGSQGIPNPH
jgi:hypothetical protein